MKGEWSLRERCKELNFYRCRLQLRIEGFKADKLLNMAFRKGILMRRICVLSETEITVWIAAGDLKKLKKLAKSLYKITVLQEKGPECGVKKIRRQPFVLLGIALAAAVIFTRSLLISTVIVDGYKAIPEESLLKCLSESGIYEGAWRPDIEWEKARKTLYDTFPEITWVKLVYDGTAVYLDIAETDDLRDTSRTDADGDAEDTDDAEDTGKKITYTDLVAEKSGYVESVQPLWGEARVEAGDYVKKGQVLIGGCIPIEPTTFEEGDAKEYYVKAQGEVWARVPYRLNFAQERYKENARSLQGENAEKTAEKSAEETAKGGENKKIIIENKTERTTEEIKAKAEQQIRLWAKENLPENAEILNKSLNFTPKENIIEIGVTLEVRREITKEQETVVGQENSDHRGD